MTAVEPPAPAVPRAPGAGLPARASDALHARVSPAEIRTGVRLSAIYTEAAAHILAEEEALDSSASATVDDLVGARFQDLTTDPVRFAAYLDDLELSHGADPAMAAYIAQSRARLAATADQEAAA